MITDFQIQYRGGVLLLGIAVEHAGLDILSDPATLKACLALLRSPHRGLVSLRMGSFGPHPVTLNLHHNESVSVFVDGPEFDSDRTQCASILIGKDELCRILEEVTGGEAK